MRGVTFRAESPMLAQQGVQPCFPLSGLALHAKGGKKRDIMLINNSNTSRQTSRIYLLHHRDQAANRRRWRRKSVLGKASSVLSRLHPCFTSSV
jgi:hypothetical protein